MSETTISVFLLPCGGRESVSNRDMKEKALQVQGGSFIYHKFAILEIRLLFLTKEPLPRTKQKIRGPSKSSLRRKKDGTVILGLKAFCLGSPTLILWTRWNVRGQWTFIEDFKLVSQE